ncbi:hypothetical protein JCM5805K_0911 [Lactococcus lactis subsp. lactis]|uniref:Uncharacterized protein n=1 Tax=Lactococcus lactis subsp. lactis TaxID=1360 RepID=A0A0B8R0L6_LACLL|nr:hypothetical protein JCM5805K_0911 [Lactococcus lactis subsp. lactis]
MIDLSVKTWEISGNEKQVTVPFWLNLEASVKIITSLAAAAMT